MGCKAIQSLHQGGFTDANRQEVACAAFQLHHALVASQQRPVNILQAPSLHAAQEARLQEQGSGSCQHEYDTD